MVGGGHIEATLPGIREILHVFSKNPAASDPFRKINLDYVL